MKFFDFFAGIGGFRLGMEQAGHECVGHCEIDKWANLSYNAMHHPKESEVYFDDIRTVNASDMPECECYCFGFPCQAFSVSGYRRGFEDTRGTLFFEVMRLAKVRRPSILFAENVVGLLNHEGGQRSERSLPQWRSWGILSNGKCLTANILDHHKTGRECSLLDILEDPIRTEFFLSAARRTEFLKVIKRIQAEKDTEAYKTDSI